MSNHPFLKFMAILLKVIGVVVLVLGIVSALGLYSSTGNTFDLFGFKFTFPSAMRWAIALTPFLSGLLGFLWYYTLGSVISVLLETNNTAQATAKSVKDIELTWVAPRSTPMPAPALSAPVTATDAPQVPTDAAS